MLRSAFVWYFTFLLIFNLVFILVTGADLPERLVVSRAFVLSTVIGGIADRDLASADNRE